MPDEGVPTRPIGRTLRSAFSVALVCTLLAGMAGTSALLVVVRGFEQMAARQVPLVAVNDDLLQALTDAETSERGFLITGEEAFLDRYEPARLQFQRTLDTAEDLVEDPELAELFAEQREIGAGWFDEFADPIIALRRSDTALAVALARSGDGRQRLESFRAVNARTQDTIIDELAAARGRSRGVALFAGTIMLTLILVALVGGTRVAVRATRTVIDPLDHVVRVLRRLRAGELGARIDPTGPTEVVEVADAVNALADSAQRMTTTQEARLAVGHHIRQVSTLLQPLLDLDRVLEVAVRQLAEALGDRATASWDPVDDGASLVQWTTPGIDVVAIDSATYPPALRRLIVTAAGAQTSIRIPDTATDVRLDAVSRWFLLDRGIRSALFGAVRAGPDAMLLLSVHHTGGPHGWSDIERSLFDGLLREIATAVANSLAFQHQRRSVERLEQLDRDKTDFMSNISHELRTPLTSIMGYVELLAEGDAGPLEAEQAELLDTIDRNSSRLLHLIEDLLLLSRVESGTFTMRYEPVDLAAVIHEVVGSLEPLIRARPVELTIDVPPHGIQVTGDVGHLERVLMNLLTNAVKFTLPRGRVVLVVSVVDGVAEIEVTDTGIGIPLAEQDRMFERFFRASTAQKHAVQGTGLGLAITKTIVDRHGGGMTFTSEEGHGTTFVVTIPLADAGATEGDATCLVSTRSS